MKGVRFFFICLATLPVLIVGQRNLAERKPTRQSSTAYSGYSSKAVDGNNNNRYFGRSCTHTRRQRGPWWRVDLQGQYTVKTVRITNRGDCCGYRLRRFDVYVGNNRNSGGPGNSICARKQSIRQGRTKDIRCRAGATGRYVFIRIPGRQYLTLCEVEVYGSKPGYANVAEGKPTKQSSTGYGGYSSRAVDGNHNNRYGGRSCTHTRLQRGPWWRVDLQGIYKVNMVRITNRGDCCGYRLRRFDVYVGNIGNSGGPGNAICARGESIRQGQTEDIHCRAGALGRYVFIRIPGRQYLTLCEVEVYGSKAAIVQFPTSTAIAKGIKDHLFTLLKAPGSAHIFILVDSAGNSVENQNFALLKDFVSSLVQAMPNNENNRVGVMSYANNGRDYYTLRNRFSKQGIISAIKSIRFGGSKNLVHGLNRVIEIYQRTHSIWKPNAKRLVLLFSTGKDSRASSHDLSNLKNDFNQDNFHVFSFGIQQADMHELKQITSFPYSKHLFMIQNYGSLSSISSKLTGSIVKPTTPPTSGNKEVYDRCNRRCKVVNGKPTDCARVRKDFTSMTSDERKRYINTYKTASMREPYRTTFNRLIALHSRLFSTSIHQSSEFLAWHRWYILQLENLLQRIDCKVTVPFWDWSLWSHKPWDTAHLWRSSDDGFGGNGRAPDYCVRDGPFAAGQWSVAPSAHQNGLTCLRRSFNGLPPDAPTVQILLKTPNNQFHIFEENLRVNLHDRVHCNFASEQGIMCSGISAAAPEFFLHHAFVDKIWNDWQKKSTVAKNAFFSRRTSRMTGSQSSPSQVFDLEKQPGGIKVIYDDPTHDGAVRIIRKLKGMSVKRLDTLPRSQFSPINRRVFQLFHVNDRERAMSRKFESKVKPVNVVQQSTLKGSQRALGFSF